MHELTTRLDRLERKNRWLTRSVVGLALCFITIVAAAFKPKDGVVEAGKFILVDAKGDMRASLFVDPDGTAGLHFFDSNDVGRLSMGLGKNGAPRIILQDESTTEPGVAYLVVSSTDLTLLDATGKPRVGMGLFLDGTPTLYLGDAKGRQRAKLRVKDDGTPHLMFVDEKDNVTWEAPK